MKYLLLLATALITGNCLAQNIENIELQLDSGVLSGELSIPTSKNKIPLVVLIAGSGATDRNGNSSATKSNCYKTLSDSLIKLNMATFRFDKRKVGKSLFNSLKEDNLSFDMFVDDVNLLVNKITLKHKFSRIYILGHSEGSLIGILACQRNKKINGFISLSGASERADSILIRQLDQQPKAVKDIVFPMLDTLSKGKLLTDVPKSLYALFRPSVQPYMISWMKYSPCVEIQKLTIPILILQGKNDLQVTETDAKRLSKANPSAKLVLFENTNHVLKIVNTKEDNVKSYQDANYPLNQNISIEIKNFISSKNTNQRKP